MKIDGIDLFVGTLWIVISILQTFILGWNSWAIWIATITIWLFIIRVNLLKK